MSRPFVLLGGGGHTSDVLSVFEVLGVPQASLVVADDAGPAHRFSGRATPHQGTIETALQLDARFIVSIGYPGPRRDIAETGDKVGAAWAEAVVHPHASIGIGAQFAEGCVVLGQTWISPGVRVDRHALVSYGCTLGHDTRIGAFASVMPGAAIGGSVQIEEAVLVGANATVLQGVKIGAGATIGAGAVVTNDIRPGQTVIGTPARPM